MGWGKRPFSSFASCEKKMVRWNQMLTMTVVRIWLSSNWKILKEMGMPKHLTCLLRNQYAGQEATVRNGNGKTDWFQIGKGVCQSCILSLCLFNLYAEYIMWNARLDEAQTGSKISERNISDLRYADDTTLMAESEELKCFLMNVKEESEKVGLKLHIQKKKKTSTFRKWRSWHQFPSLHGK